MQGSDTKEYRTPWLLQLRVRSHYISETDGWQVYVLDVNTGAVRTVARIKGKDPIHDDALVQAHVDGRYVSYHRAHVGGFGQVEVVDTVEKRARVVYTYNTYNLGPYHTAVNNRYAFWLPGALFAADLNTGAQRRLTDAIVGCDRLCTTETAFLCSTTTAIVSVNPDTSKVTMIAPTPALQVDGVCSPDKTRFVWVDYRDPPGPSSTYDGQRTGGEVYFYDLTTNELTRVTHDSPDNPTAKSYPAIEGDTVVWEEAGSSHSQNPEWAQDIYYWLKPALVWYDLKTKKRCKTDALHVVRPSVIRGKVYGAYVVPYDAIMAGEPEGVYVVQVDLSSPDIPWVCTQEQ